MVRLSQLYLLLAGAVWAQQPFFPSVAALPGSPSRVLYGTYKTGIVKSTDNGVTWVPIYVTEPGLPQPPVTTLNLDILDGNILYLATTMAAGGIWKSTDAGATWTKMNSGLPATGTVEYLKQG